jgi:hypothetical protein
LDILMFLLSLQLLRAKGCHTILHLFKHEFIEERSTRRSCQIHSQSMGAVCVIPSVSSRTEGVSSAFTVRQSLRLEWSLIPLTRMKSRKQRQVFYETNETKIFLINFLLQICAHLEVVLDRLAYPQ